MPPITRPLFSSAHPSTPPRIEPISSDDDAAGARLRSMKEAP
ncbi:Hypothetical protein A7982_08743 [Minicystis rosea]|nr:Hypothetical protein A7982_08743 [Minicystis rosea]